MSSDALALAAILGAIVVGAASPGPSFVYISQSALARGRGTGIAGAMGMGVGSILFALAAIVGLSALLLAAEWMFVVLKIAGGGYLVVLGARMWRNATSHRAVAAAVEEVPSGPVWRSVLGGAAAQLGNPKAVVVYGSIFATLLPPDPAPWLLVAIPIGVFAIEAGWYTLVATVMSASGARRAYRRFATAIDRGAGTVLGALGGWFAVDGVRTALR